MFADAAHRHQGADDVSRTGTSMSHKPTLPADTA